MTHQTRHRSPSHWMIAIHAALLSLSLTGAVGPAHAATINAGDLLISEIMINPSAVSDTRGEWFELYNASQQMLSLDGLALSDGGSDLHILAAPGLVMAPGDFAVFGRNADNTTNGGVDIDYKYSGITLANSIDSLILMWQGAEIFRLDYNDDFASSGRSSELLQRVIVSDGSHYGLTSQELVYGDGDSGTPGLPGSAVLDSAEVPLPGSAMMLGAALAGLGSRLRRMAGAA